MMDGDTRYLYASQTAYTLGATPLDIPINGQSETIWVNIANNTVISGGSSSAPGTTVTILPNGTGPGFGVTYGSEDNIPLHGVTWIRIEGNTANVTFIVSDFYVPIRAVSVWGGAGTGGVTSITAGTGISASPGSPATGAVTVTNTGVTSLVAGTGISLSGSTGAVTVSTVNEPTTVATAKDVTVTGATTLIIFTASDSQAHQFRRVGNFDVSVSSSGVVTLTLAYKDSNGVSQSHNPSWRLFNAGFTSGASVSIAANQNYAFDGEVATDNSNTAVSLTLALNSGTFTAKFSGVIVQEW